MTAPEKNIKVDISEEEVILREKADIHKARLQKFGRSKMNGKMFFRESNKRVFTYSQNGEKEYL